MDHHPHLVIHGAANDPSVDVILAVTAYKKCQARRIPGPSLHLNERNLVVMNFWPIFDYLEERHPFPPLLPTGIQERAVIRSLAGQAMNNPATILPSLLTRGLTNAGFLLLDQPTLVDIIAATINIHPTPPIVTKLRTNLGMLSEAATQ